MEELLKCKYCNYSNSNLIELNNHNLTCYKKYINEILLKNLKIDNFVKSVCKNRAEPDTDVGVRPDAKTEFNRTVKRS